MPLRGTYISKRKGAEIKGHFLTTSTGFMTQESSRVISGSFKGTTLNRKLADPALEGVLFS